MEAKLTTVKSENKRGSTSESEPPPKKRSRKNVASSSKECDYWSTIPDGILCLVAEKINLLEEYVRFSAVCRLWYQFSADYYNDKKKFEFVAPFFMQQEAKRCRGKRVSSKRTFYSYSSQRSFLIDLPETTGLRCWGSPFGWIVTFNPKDLQFCLLNPFSRASISLPSIRTLIGPDAVSGKFNLLRRYVKAFLTASPEEPDCLVLVLLNLRGDLTKFGDFVLGFTKPGICTAWTRIEGPSNLRDIISVKGNLYGVRNSHCPEEIFLVMIQIQQPVPRVVEFASPTKAILGGLSFPGEEEIEEASGYKVCWKYLVELEGELCLVLRYVEYIGTCYIKIFKMDLSTKKWSRIHPQLRSQRGSHCFFVGNSYSFSCKANVPAPSFSDYKKPPGPPKNFVPDHVFYTHDCVVPRDEGVFDLLTSRILRRDNDTGNLNLSLWITPSLRFRQLKTLEGPRRCKSIRRKKIVKELERSSISSPRKNCLHNCI